MLDEYLIYHRLIHIMKFQLLGILLITFNLFQTTLFAEENTQTNSSKLSTVQNNLLIIKHDSKCSDLDPIFVKCDFNTSCVYGELSTVDCHVNEEIHCKGEHAFPVTFPCLYCWQVPESFYSCTFNSTCKANTRYLTRCNVNATTYCLGHRQFNRYIQCNLVSGHKWSMAVVLSILFGGFGIDRFYLGHWQEGVGKLFSFGGFGVWTLIDTILISIGYLKPADSSQYEYL